MKFLLFSLKIYYNTIGLIFPKNSVKRLSNLFSSPRKTVLRPKEIELLKEAKKSYFESKEFKIALYEWGSGQEYVLLVHGWESNAGSLGAFINPLIKKGYKVISFDGPAHGNSSGKQASLLKFKDVVIEILNHFGLPKIAIGHSLGANAILLACAEEKYNLPFTILFAPVNRVSKVFYEFKEMISIPDSLFKGLLDELENRTGYLLRNLDFHDIAPKTILKNILVLHDVNDQITPINHSQEIVKNWHHATLVEIEGSGHYRILWNKNAIESVLNYLNH